jgi:hypothetical protein
MALPVVLYSGHGTPYPCASDDHISICLALPAIAKGTHRFHGHQRAGSDDRIGSASSLVFAHNDGSLPRMHSRGAPRAVNNELLVVAHGVVVVVIIWSGTSNSACDIVWQRGLSGVYIGKEKGILVAGAILSRAPSVKVACCYRDSMGIMA